MAIVDFKAAHREKRQMDPLQGSQSKKEIQIIEGKSFPTLCLLQREVWISTVPTL